MKWILSIKVLYRDLLFRTLPNARTNANETALRFKKRGTVPNAWWALLVWGVSDWG